jgi:hypothetical protein
MVTPDSLSPYIAPNAKDEVVWADLTLQKLILKARGAPMK